MKVLLLLAALGHASAADVITSEQNAFFESRIRPVLAEKCYSCHSAEAEKVKGALLLDTREGIRLGGDTGPAVVPGNLDESLLIAAIRYTDEDTAMPPKNKGGKLPDSVIADFEQWVREGAPDPREGTPAPLKTAAPNSESWWSYQPLLSPQAPLPKNETWSRDAIDQFILAALDARNLSPVPDADLNSILRRLYLDLAGVPPPPEAVERFIKNPDITAIVDSLLSTRQFAERWARHWLDVARYAESTGRDVNVTLPESWRYRDYVIESFLVDKPFDQFIREQIAGDLLPSQDEKDRARKQIATGFLAIGAKALNETDPRQFAVDLADEQIETVSLAFLGQTVSCARCHDHKFDPITQRDYTALAGIFLSSETHFGTPGGVQARNASTLIEIPAGAGLGVLDRRMDPVVWEEKKARLDSLTAQRDAALAERRPNAGNKGKSSTSDLTSFDIVRIITSAKQLEIDLAAFNADGSLKPRVMGVSDRPTTAAPRRGPGGGPGGGGQGGRGRRTSGFEIIADSPFFNRGSIEKEEDNVPRGLPAFLSHNAEIAIPAESSGRLQLAEWIASPENTLTSRVIVNRVWHWLFGRGLVSSVDNFGSTGAEPSHPELLDFLARDFVAEGWSIRKLVRKIVLSRTYQLATQHDEKNFAADPDNTLLWRMSTRRLDAETLRDSMLAASGSLDLKPPMGSMIGLAGDGPISGERFHVLKEETIAQSGGNFRSLYLPVARSVQPETLAVFDFTDPTSVLGARESTIVPPQALYLMNSEFVNEQATAMAARVLRLAPNADFEARFRIACLLAFSRPPTGEETSAARAFLTIAQSASESDAWTSICRALFASAEFRYLN